MSFASFDPTAYDPRAPEKKGDLVVLVSFVLVLAAAVTLVIGLVAGDGLGLIYVSIACSLSAGIVLAVAVLRSRPQVELAGVGSASQGERDEVFGPLPAAGLGGERAEGGEVAAVAGAQAVPVTEEAAATWGLAEHWEPEERAEETTPGAAAQEAAGVPVVPAQAGAAASGEPIFPIADYDELRVAEIMPLLPELDPDELEMVRAHEAAGKARATLLARIDQLLGRPAAPAPRRARPAAKAAGARAQAGAARGRAAQRAAQAGKALATGAKKVTAAKEATKKAASAKKAAPAKTAAPAKPAKKAAPAKTAAPAKKAAARSRRSAKEV